MPAWVIEWLPAAPWLAVVLALVVVAVKYGKPAFEFLTKVVHFFDDLIGEEARPGVPARPGLLVRMETMEHSLSDSNAKADVAQVQLGSIQVKLDTVHHELFPNSGSSLRDQTDRIEANVEKIDKRSVKDFKEINALKKQLSSLKMQLGEVKDDTSTATGILKTISTQGEES